MDPKAEIKLKLLDRIQCESFQQMFERNFLLICNQLQDHIETEIEGVNVEYLFINHFIQDYCFMPMPGTYFVKCLSLSELRTHFKTSCPRTTQKLPELKTETFPEGEMLQVNLCLKLSFLNQLTHNMTRDCSLNSPKNTSSEHVVYNLNVKTKKNLYTACSELVFFGEFNEQSHVILMRASEKDLPVIQKYQRKHLHRLKDRLCILFFLS